MTLKVCWVSGMHISFRRAAAAYRRCVTLCGHEIVRSPQEADVVVVEEDARKIGLLISGLKGLKRHPIGYIVWETTVFPESLAASLPQDMEIWTASSFCHSSISQYFNDVKIVPHVMEKVLTNQAWEDKVRSHFGIPRDKFIFYTFARQDTRKNSNSVLEAFNAAGVQDCHLAYIDSGSLQDKTIGALHEIGDCYVSLHHAEGWGLNMSEALAHGNHVIASRYGGCLDFLNDTNSHLVDCEPVEVYEKKYRPSNFSGSMTWGQPSLDSAIDSMRHVASAHRYVKNDAAYDTGKQFNEDVVASRIGNLLECYCEAHPPMES